MLVDFHLFEIGDLRGSRS